MAFKRTNVSLSEDPSHKIGALASKGVAAAFCDAVRIETADCIFLYMSGATPIDDDGNVVGRTMKEQTRQVLERLKRVVEHEGGRMTDIVRVRVYVTDISSGALRQIHQARNLYFPAGARPASTLVQITAIIRDGGMIEIDADAVLPAG